MHLRTFKIKTEYYFFKDLKRIVFMALGAVEMMRFLYFQILFQIADMGLLLLNIMPKVCLFVILHRESAQLVQEIVKLEILRLMSFFY